MEVGQSDLWTSQGCKVVADFILRSEEARQRGFTVESHPKCPTLFCVREADGVIELHVDDGHVCGKETIVAELLAFRCWHFFSEEDCDEVCARNLEWQL